MNRPNLFFNCFLCKLNLLHILLFILLLGLDQNLNQILLLVLNLINTLLQWCLVLSNVWFITLLPLIKTVVMGILSEWFTLSLLLDTCLCCLFICLKNILLLYFNLFLWNCLTEGVTVWLDSSQDSLLLWLWEILNWTFGSVTTKSCERFLIWTWWSDLVVSVWPGLVLNLLEVRYWEAASLHWFFILGIGWFLWCYFPLFQNTSM